MEYILSIYDVLTFKAAFLVFPRGVVVMEGVKRMIANVTWFSLYRAKRYK